MSFHHRGQFDAKPKAHKNFGKFKSSSLGKPGGRLVPDTEKSTKKSQSHNFQWHDKGKAQRFADRVERRKQHREETIRKKLQYYGKIHGGIPKIVALVPLSKHARCRKIRSRILKYCKQENTDTMEGAIPCTAQIGNRDVNFIIWECKHNQWSILDIAKIADIVLLVATPAPDKNDNENQQNQRHQKQNEQINSFQDEILGIDSDSKLFCSLLRSQGVSNVFGLYQPRYNKQINSIANAKFQCKIDNKIAKLFENFISYEFGHINKNNIRILHCYDCQQLFRFMDICQHCEIEWKFNRNYLLAENIYFEQQSPKDLKGTLQVTGFLRGGRPLNINHPIHITGVGDFLVSRVDGIVMSKPTKVPVLPSIKRSQKKEERKKTSSSIQEKKDNDNDDNNNDDDDDDDDNNDDDDDNDNNNDNNNNNNDNDNDNNNNNNNNDNNNNDKEKKDIKMNDINNNNNNNDKNEIQQFLDNDSDGGDISLKNVFEDLDRIEQNKHEKNIVSFNLSKKEIKKNDKENNNFILAVADKNTQDSLETLKKIDELATVMDQSIISEEELKANDQARKEELQKLSKKQENERKKIADHRVIWEEALGWNNEDEENYNEYNNDLNNLAKEMKDLRINEEEMENPQQILIKKKELYKQEQEYPDEVDTPLFQRAKDKFAQYRGLKSISNTKWDRYELLPIEYSQIYQINDWKQAKKQSKLDEKSIELGQIEGIKTGHKIKLYIDDVPISAASLWTNKGAIPLIVWGLLQHEHKISVCHYLIKCDTNYKYPVQGLDSYIFDLGYRRLNARPIFSEHSRLDKHLVQKFMNPGELCVASIYAPIQYPPMPVLMFENPESQITKLNVQQNENINDNKMENTIYKPLRIKRQKDLKIFKNNKEKEAEEEEEENKNETLYDEDDEDIYDYNENKEALQILSQDKKIKRKGHEILIGNKGLLKKPSSLIAIGDLLQVNTHRILLKRKVLTGHLIRTHRRRAIVRYMFWNADDVRYFKPLDLWTKNGLKGKIEEPIGEKGYMKCFFNDFIKGTDVVCLSLYKRIFPVANPKMFNTTIIQH